MNTEEQSQIYQTLFTRRQEIAQVWLDTLIEASPTAREIPDLPTQLLKTTEQLITLLISEPFNVEPAQKTGAKLDILDNFQPQDLNQMFMVVAQALTTGLTPEHIVIVQPRIAGLLGVLSTGFFTGKAERMKTFDMNAMSRMGHDLKTPINAITGFSRVILKGIDGPITEFQQQDLTSIYDAGQKLLTMIDELFRTAKNDAAKTDLYAPTFNVIDLISDIMRVGQPIVAQQEHTLEVRCVGDLGTMSADASQVRWILLGLLYYTARLTTNSTISLAAIRENVQNMEWFFFEITMMLPDHSSEREKLAAEFWSEREEKDEADIALITSRRFCETLGGNLMTEHDGNWLAKFTVRLPAR